MKYYKILFCFCLILFVQSCATVKEGFSNQKKNNTDEFLVEKKAPLVMPPNYNELPIPNEGDLSTEKNNNNVKDLISSSEDQKSVSTDSNSANSIEKSVLDKIKQ
tara:strand:+ start:224 stop:538 length:315 start_codon:yes stop_codon:yes gene_type:complete